MSESYSELSLYINDMLEKNFNLTSIIKESDISKIYLYTHKKSKKKIIKRVSAHRNDEVFRVIRNKVHNNLSQIYEVCSDDDNVTVIEEFIEGKTLLEILDEKNGISKKQAFQYTYDICNALEVLHSLGIIHRDIKPSNVIITNENTAVLIDLSIARIFSGNAESDTQNLGSVGYASPEQFGLSQTGKATDIYSLGVLLNIMLTGVHPAIKQAKGLIGNMIKKMTAMEIKSRYQDVKKIKRRLRLLMIFA